MHRIASGLLLVLLVFAVNGSLLRDVMAAEPSVARADIAQPSAPAQSSRLLSLLVVLESLRQAPLTLEPQKG